MRKLILAAFAAIMALSACKGEDKTETVFSPEIEVSPDQYFPNRDAEYLDFANYLYDFENFKIGRLTYKLNPETFSKVQVIYVFNNGQLFDIYNSHDKKGMFVFEGYVFLPNEAVITPNKAYFADMSDKKCSLIRFKLDQFEVAEAVKKQKLVDCTDRALIEEEEAFRAAAMANSSLAEAKRYRRGDSFAEHASLTVSNYDPNASSGTIDFSLEYYLRGERFTESGSAQKNDGAYVSDKGFEFTISNSVTRVTDKNAKAAGRDFSGYYCENLYYTDMAAVKNYENVDLKNFDSIKRFEDIENGSSVLFFAREAISDIKISEIPQNSASGAETGKELYSLDSLPYKAALRIDTKFQNGQSRFVISYTTASGERASAIIANGKLPAEKLIHVNAD